MDDRIHHALRLPHIRVAHAGWQLAQFLELGKARLRGSQILVRGQYRAKVDDLLDLLQPSTEIALIILVATENKWRNLVLGDGVAVCNGASGTGSCRKASSSHGVPPSEDCTQHGRVGEPQHSHREARRAAVQIRSAGAEIASLHCMQIEVSAQHG